MYHSGTDEIPPGVFFAGTQYRRIKYRTKDGQADYEFSFERMPNGIHRAYILSQPGYGPRDPDLVITHRSFDGERHYVCWKPEPTSEQTLEKVVAIWCDLTQEYIRTGRRLDAQLDDLRGR